MGGFRLPSLVENTVSESQIHIDESIYLAGPDAVIKSTQVDAGASPTTTIRKGNVLVKKTSDGLYYVDDGATNAASADRNTPASVSASETADADWASKTITCTVNGGVAITVTLGAGDDTDAEVVTALNASASFQAAGLIADTSASRVRIRTVSAGRNQYLSVTSNLATAFGSSGTTGYGTDADYVVTETEVSTLHPASGVAMDTPVKTSRAAFYKESALKSANASISNEARAVLMRNGARFG